MVGRQTENAKFLNFANMTAQLMWLNVLVLACSLPLITAGAAMTAMHYVLIRVLRDGNESVTRCFFRSFRKNFWQATAVWGIYLLIFALLGVDYLTMKQLDLSQIRYVRYFVPVIAFIVSLSLVWVFVILARYSVSTKQAFLFAITRVIAYPARTVLMVAVCVAPIVACLYVPSLLMVYILLGVAGSGYLCSRIYNKALNDMEDETQK